MKEQVEDVVIHKFTESMSNFYGAVSAYVPFALAKLAVTETLSESGQVCGECSGTGRRLAKDRHTYKCQACKKGLVEWDDLVRYGFFCYQLPVTLSRFNKFLKHYRPLIDELKKERQNALTVLQEQLDNEDKAA